MTDSEYELLDELYFIQDFEELQQKLGLSDSELSVLLSSVIAKGWVRCASRIDGLEVPEPKPEIFKKQSFLATKEGLFAHNSTDN